MKRLLVIMIMSLGLTGCVPDIEGDTTIENSYNNTTNTNAHNTYTSEQEDIIKDGYVPDEEGVCREGYFWCSIEEKCLPSIEGASCPVGHNEVQEAEADEANQT